MLPLLSTIVVCYVSPALSVEVVMSAKAAVVRKEPRHVTSKQTLTCEQIQDAFEDAGRGHHTQTTFCTKVNTNQLTSRARCCQPDPETPCCAKASHCRMSEIFEALDMGSCGASLVSMKSFEGQEPDGADEGTGEDVDTDEVGDGEGQGEAEGDGEGEADADAPKSTDSECSKVSKQFKKEGNHHHTELTFCIDAASLQPPCCQEPDGPPDGCCKREDHCEMKDIYKALSMVGCDDYYGR